MRLSNGKNTFFLISKAVGWLLLGISAIIIIFIMYAVFAGTNIVTLSEFSDDEERQISEFLGMDANRTESLEIKKLEYVNDIVSGSSLTLEFSLVADEADFSGSSGYMLDIVSSDNNGRVLMELTYNGFVNPELLQIIDSKGKVKSAAKPWILAAVTVLIASFTLIMAVRCVVRIFKRQ